MSHVTPASPTISQLGDLFSAEHYQFSPAAIPYFVVALLIAGAGLLVLRRERASRISILFSAYSLTFAAWVACRGWFLLLFAPELLVIVARLSYALTALAVPLLFQFILALLRILPRRQVHLWLSWLSGIVLLVLSISSPWVVSGLRQHSWGLEPALGVLGPSA